MKANESPATAGALLAGMILCRENARELLEEADMLAERGRHARAFALAYTACEELGKFSILETGVRRLINGNPPNWKRFWQRFRSHESKSAQLLVRIYMLATSLPDGDEIGDLAKLILGDGLIVRNAALYVDEGDAGRLRKPSDMNFDVPLPGMRFVTVHALAAADQRGVTLSDIEAYLRNTPDYGSHQAAAKVLVRMMERGREAGITTEQMVALFSKYWNKV